MNNVSSIRPQSLGTHSLCWSQPAVGKPTVFKTGTRRQEGKRERREKNEIERVRDRRKDRTHKLTDMHKKHTGKLKRTAIKKKGKETINKGNDDDPG